MTSMPPNSQPVSAPTDQSRTTATPRSPFVTVVGSLAILFSAPALLGLPDAVLLFTSGGPDVPADLEHKLPSFVSFALANFRALIALQWFLMTLTFAAGVGVLLRKEWARRLCVALLACSIVGVWTIFGLQAALVFEIFSRRGDVSVVVQHPVVWIGLGISSLLALGFTLLLGWTMRRLRSSTVLSEFTSAG